MMACLDDQVGHIMKTLRETGIEDKTLVVFLSDNGGYPGNASLNTPYSGTKSQMLEGGIREPFIVQWKGQLPAGEIYEEPVISLDILSTALAAAGAKIKPEWKLDGVNLLPFLSGEKQGAPHEVLYWRFNFPSARPEKYGWAIRKGDWKLVKNGWAKAPVALYNLSSDPGEKNDLSNQYPEQVNALKIIWDEWNRDNQ